MPFSTKHCHNSQTKNYAGNCWKLSGSRAIFHSTRLGMGGEGEALLALLFGPYKYVRPQMVYFQNCFGIRIDIDFCNFGMKQIMFLTVAWHWVFCLQETTTYFIFSRQHGKSEALFKCPRKWKPYLVSSGLKYKSY